MVELHKYLAGPVTNENFAHVLMIDPSELYHWPLLFENKNETTPPFFLSGDGKFI